MLIKLSIKEKNATLSNLNTRTEKNGDDDIPAADIHISLNLGADVLGVFSKDLQDALFKPETDLAGGKLALKQPELDYPIGIVGEMANATVKIGHGISDKAMEFKGIKVNDFKITPIEGGAVLLKMRAQCKPTEEQIGQLYILQKQPITVWVIPGKEPEMSAAKDKK